VARARVYAATTRPTPGSPDPGSSQSGSVRSQHARMPVRFPRSGRLAQLGEHQLDKLGVTGSSPVPPTHKNPARAGFLFSGRPTANGETAAWQHLGNMSSRDIRRPDYSEYSCTPRPTVARGAPVTPMHPGQLAFQTALSQRLGEARHAESGEWLDLLRRYEPLLEIERDRRVVRGTGLDDRAPGARLGGERPADKR
jgi:hypothetical protein